MVAASGFERAHVRDVFDENGLFDKIFAGLCLALSLLLLDLSLGRHRHGGSIVWAVIGGVMVVASGWQTVRRFRRRD